MSNFSVDHFVKWFKTIYGKGFEPFPWQKRLVEEILSKQQSSESSNACWPSLLDLPTGTGKTSAIDIAIYTQAADPTNAPRRIIYVVDRRAIVDQTYDHVRKIQQKLLNATEGPSLDVAQALRSRTASSRDIPLELAQLRGGIRLDKTWASEPDIPAVLVSTVDQVGSRLLFRGYGESKRMRPIHAGLLGNDCLWLLDEVHLSRPFAQTLLDIQELKAEAIRGGLPERNGLVQMTATPVGLNTGERFSLTKEDIQNSALLKQRVNASKEVHLQSLKVEKDDRFEDVIIKEISHIVENLSGSVIGVIVNRVHTAVQVGKELSKTGNVYTLTGRMRPLERKRIWSKIECIARAGRDRNIDKERVIIVSTQAIEAGADLDFDAMVTEIASLDAIVQRMGRVDRRGELSAKGSPAKVVIIAPSLKAQMKNDPVYGNTQLETWTELNKHMKRNKPFTFNRDFLTQIEDDVIKKCTTPKDKTTKLLSHHLDALCQTCPEPNTQPEISYFLHGVSEQRGEVTVIWRGEMPKTDASNRYLEGLVGPERSVAVGSLERDLVRQLLYCPPRIGEGIAVPIPAFKQWISSIGDREEEARQRGLTKDPAPIADVERFDYVGHEESIFTRSLKKISFLRWEGVESQWISGSEVRPGDVLIVPLSWGGIHQGNWDPTNTSPVEDLGDLAQWERDKEYGSGRTIRVGDSFGWHISGLRSSEVQDDLSSDMYVSKDKGLSGLLQNKLLDEAGINFSRIHPQEGAYRDKKNNSYEGSDNSPGEFNIMKDEVQDSQYKLLTEDFKVKSVLSIRKAISNEPYIIVLGHSLEQFSVRNFYYFESDGSDISSCLIGTDLLLSDHCRDVAEQARSSGETLGISELAESLFLAGDLHDIGKIHPGFQAMLHGGDRIAVNLDKPLAKSKTKSENASDLPNLYAISGCPQGFRHELLSLALLESALDFEQLEHIDLIKYLVTTHHGMCRALPPAQNDEYDGVISYNYEGIRMQASYQHELDDIGSGVLERFWKMTRTYGWYGIAWIESILRLADHRQSAWRAWQTTSTTQVEK